MGAEAQTFGKSCAAFPGHLHGVDLEVQQLGHKLAPVWDVWIIGGDLTGYTTMLALCLCFKAS